MSQIQKYKLIKDLLEKTGLTGCSSYRIGTDEIGMKVLSGGEKKRLAFAAELLISPAILFCDEPTTGLDSYSAQQLVGTLLTLARTGTTIMCTIHQPSSQLFSMFHQVTLLADGRVAFIGTPSQALDFFAGYVWLNNFKVSLCGCKYHKVGKFFTFSKRFFFRFVPETVTSAPIHTIQLIFLSVHWLSRLAPKTHHKSQLIDCVTSMRLANLLDVLTC